MNVNEIGTLTLNQVNTVREADDHDPVNLNSISDCKFHSMSDSVNPVRAKRVSWNTPVKANTKTHNSRQELGHKSARFWKQMNLCDGRKMFESK